MRYRFNCQSGRRNIVNCNNNLLFVFKPFKFLHAVRLCEAGLASRAQDYCREVAEFVMRNPAGVQSDFMPDFLQQLQHLADRLKYQVSQNIYRLFTTFKHKLRKITPLFSPFNIMSPFVVGTIHVFYVLKTLLFILGSSVHNLFG